MFYYRFLLFWIKAPHSARCWAGQVRLAASRPGCLRHGEVSHDSRRATTLTPDAGSITIAAWTARSSCDSTCHRQGPSQCVARLDEHQAPQGGRSRTWTPRPADGSARSCETWTYGWGGTDGLYGWLVSERYGSQHAEPPSWLGLPPTAPGRPRTSLPPSRWFAPAVPPPRRAPPRSPPARHRTHRAPAGRWPTTAQPTPGPRRGQLSRRSGRLQGARASSGCQTPPNVDNERPSTPEDRTSSEP